MDLTETLGYVAAFFVLMTFSMKTMIQLRIIGIVSNVFFIAYGYLNEAYPVMGLHCILLPLNSLRLWQIMMFVRKIEEATRNDGDMDWLKSITRRRSVRAGERLFSRGDIAGSMIFIVSGSFVVVELGLQMNAGQLVGEIGLLSPDKTRTQSIACVADGEVLEITYDEVKQLYFQSPKFGFYLLQLASRRLLDNIDRLEKEVAVHRAAALAGKAL